MTNRQLRLLVLGLVVALAVLPILVYLGDAAVLRYRMSRGDGGLQAVQVYMATRLKSGKLEIFTERPHTEICASALLPHFGYRPCWWVRRSAGVKVI
jgi:hypothetical protein